MSRTVFAAETEHDKDLYTLAYTKAMCNLSKCTIDCEQCDTYDKWVACYTALPACDQLRVDNTANDIVARVHMSRSLLYNNNRSRRVQQIHKTIRTIIMALVVVMTISFAGAAFCLFHSCSRPKQEPPIENCIYTIKSRLPGYDRIADINRDGLSDCIDCAIGFKLLWDNTYSYPCELVRNKNPINGMHHLFCRVLDNDTWIYIEPDSRFYMYDMNAIWGSRYDPKYNIYGESYRWMKEVVYGKCKN